MTSIPADDLQGHEREAKLIGLLDRSRVLQAYDVFPYIGVSWHDASTHFSAFVQFLNVYLRARKILERHGLTIERTNDGTPAAEYWIEHLRS